jgi:hypothetical protein
LRCQGKLQVATSDSIGPAVNGAVFTVVTAFLRDDMGRCVAEVEAIAGSYTPMFFALAGVIGVLGLAALLAAPPRILVNPTTG